MFSMGGPFVRMVNSTDGLGPDFGTLFGQQFGFQPASDMPQGFDTAFAGPFAWMGVPDPAFFDAAFQAEGEDGPRQPPAAAGALQAMPVVKVTENDIEEENSECTICLEKLSVGDAALRIPCGHLFHEDCVRTWLQSNNQCPMCRYELPTDDAITEQGRRERMMNRKPRLTLKALSGRCIRELVYLARHLGVSINGCLEKHEIVTAIVESGCVDIMPAAVETTDLQTSRKSESSLSTTAAEVNTSEPSISTPALLAITDGDPIIQSFLGDRRPLAALSKHACSVLTGLLSRKPSSEDIQTAHCDGGHRPAHLSDGCWRSDRV